MNNLPPNHPESIRRRFKDLRLTACADDVIDLLNSAIDQKMPHGTFLEKFLKTLESVKISRKCANQIKLAEFTGPADLGSFDWSHSSGFDKGQVESLCTGAFLDQGENILITGPACTGKTLIAESIARSMVENRQKAVFCISGTNLPEKLSDPMQFRKYGSKNITYPAFLKKIPLLVIDDLGMINLSERVQDRISTTILHRAEKGLSTIIVSGLQIGEIREKLGHSGAADSAITRFLRGLARNFEVPKETPPY